MPAWPDLTSPTTAPRSRARSRQDRLSRAECAVIAWHHDRASERPPSSVDSAIVAAIAWEAGAGGAAILQMIALGVDHATIAQRTGEALPIVEMFITDALREIEARL